MRVFITGGNGGIGSVIRNVFKDNGIEIISPPSKELNLKGVLDVSTIPVLDGFIHCAGINDLAHHTAVNTDGINNIMKVNAYSFVDLCGKLKFNDSSNIIAIGSLYATLTKEDRIQYTMSKHALLAAVKTIALEKAQNKIKVNMVSPGFVDTLLTRKNNSQEHIDSLNKQIPLGLTNPLEIAKFCLYLIQHNMSITGQNMQIDGGYTLKNI